MRQAAILTALVVVLVIVVAAAVCARRRLAAGLILLAGGAACLAGGAAYIAARVAPLPVRGGGRAAEDAGGEPPLIPFHGELLTREEIAAINKVARVKTPANKLPTTFGQVRSLPYRPSPYAARTALHIGQRKLLLSEVDFLTDYAREGDTVVYAGSAPGVHMPFLASLFRAKRLKFELYDPRRFVMPKGRTEALSRIATHQEYFTDEVAARYAGRDEVLFISDIRTGVPGTEENEARVAADMEAQRRWTKIMNPRAAMLKYRPPYSSDAPFEYLDGEVRVQAWAPRSTTEGRLVAERPYPVAGTSPRDHENRAYYISAVLREWAFYDHGIPTELVPGLDHCFDCALEARIWARYLGDGATPEKVAACFNRATAAISRSLDRPPHGVDPGAFMVDKRESLPSDARAGKSEASRS